MSQAVIVCPSLYLTKRRDFLIFWSHSFDTRCDVRLYGKDLIASMRGYEVPADVSQNVPFLFR